MPPFLWARVNAAGVAWSEAVFFMTKRVLLSIDWDYFIDCGGLETVSLRENHANIYLRWYKEYFQNPMFVFSYRICPGLKNFWENLKERFRLDDSCLWISESHKYSYHLCRSLNCRRIISFDAHSDLGYECLGGRGYIHCANWLGQLLRYRELEEAQVVLSPYSAEKPGDFTEYHRVSFCRPDDLRMEEGETVAGIHICRSGAWTPPWYDAQLTRFIEFPGIKRVKGSLRERPWKPALLDYSQMIETLFLINAPHVS